MRKNIELRLTYLVTRNSVYIAQKLGVSIGNDCKILGNPFLIFGSEPWLVTLGNHVEVTNGVLFITHDGAIWVLRNKKEHEKSDKFGPIKVGNNVFIGVNSIILPGITIGNNVIIGAGSVVTKNVDSNTVVAGNPAKVISSIEVYQEKNANICVPTKNLSIENKKKFLEKHFKQWF